MQEVPTSLSQKEKKTFAQIRQIKTNRQRSLKETAEKLKVICVYV